jgi:hypothetical protein
MDDLATFIAIAISALGLILTAAGLFYAGRQYSNSQRVAEADFLLRLDELLFSQHDSVHKLLRPGGKWADGAGAPSSTEEWSMLESYIGMFERIKLMLDCGLLEIDAIERFFGYRVRNIVANHEIVKAKNLLAFEDWDQLSDRERNAHTWKQFIELWHALERYRDAV